MRAQFRRVQEQLASQGVQCASALFSMTPREISLSLSIARAQAQQKRQHLWLLGKYAAIAVHAPEHYPSPPQAEMVEMTGEEMKKRLLMGAEGRGK